MAGIRDVAKRARVSTSTVSLVLNNSGYVSEDTRKKVMEAVKELHYIPNELARNLFRSKTNMIGVILPDIYHPFFGSFAKYVEIELYAYGYKMMLCSTAQRKNGEKEYIDMLNRQMMDGIIMGTHSLDVEEYKGVARPIISLDRYINEEIPIVMSDHETGGRLAAEELLKGGCKKVLQLMGSRDVDTPAHWHHLSFEKVMRKEEVVVYTEEMPWNQWDFKTFEDFIRSIIDKYPDIDAVYGADLSMVAFMKVAQEKGIQIPKDIQLVSYDGTDVTLMNTITITAVRQDIQRLAEKAVSLLINKIKGQPIEKDRIVIGVTLVKGKSTL